MSRKKRRTSKPFNVELYCQVILSTHLKVATGHIEYYLGDAKILHKIKQLASLRIHNWVSAESFTLSCRRLPLEYLYNFHISRFHISCFQSFTFSLLTHLLKIYVVVKWFHILPHHAGDCLLNIYTTFIFLVYKSSLSSHCHSAV